MSLPMIAQEIYYKLEGNAENEKSRTVPFMGSSRL